MLDIESEANWMYAHTGLFASCQLRYGLFIGEVDASDPEPVQRCFRVDVPALTARLAQFLYSQQPARRCRPTCQTCSYSAWNKSRHD